MARRQRATVEFTTLHLAMLSGCVLAASAAIFFLGIYVGRGLPSQHAGPGEQVARIPVAQAPAMPAVDRGPLRPQAPVAVASAAAKPVPKPVAIEPAPSETKPQAAAPVARPRDPVELAVASPRVPGESAAERVAEQPSGRRSIISETIARATERRPESADGAAPEAEVPQAGGSAAYTVQVLATRDAAEANTLAADLKRRQIGAFVSEVEDVGGNWYRVRIGIYDDLDSAQGMEARLRGLGLQQAYVSRYR